MRSERTALAFEWQITHKIRVYEMKISFPNAYKYRF